jgi:hypothetical protein
VLQDLDMTEALLRFLIAVPVSAVMLALLRGLANGFQVPPRSGGRRASDGANAE